MLFYNGRRDENDPLITVHVFAWIEQECCLPPEKHLDLSTYEIFYGSGIYQKQVSHVSCM